MLLVILISLFIALVFYLLFMPITLFVETRTNQYYMRAPGIAKISLEAHDGLFRIKVKTAFYTKYIDPFAYQKNNKKDNKQRIKKRRSFRFKKILGIIKTMRIIRLKLNIDTGDYVLNAKLIPVSVLLSNYGKGSYQINFLGNNNLLLQLQLRLVNIVKSILIT